MSARRLVLCFFTYERSLKMKGLAKVVELNADGRAMNNMIVVSRHPAASQFILAELGLPATTPVFNGNVTEEMVAGKHVVGNIPLRLCAVCDRVTAVEFDGTPPRGAEYSADDMRNAGATLRTYKVRRVME